MSKHQTPNTKHQTPLILLTWIFLLVLSFVFPPYNSDSIRYAVPGNPFYLQYLDYIGDVSNGAFFHGRYITHVLLRMILMLPEPFLTVFFSIVLLFIIMVFADTFAPKWREDSRFIYVYILFITLLFLSPRHGFMAVWVIHAHPMSNFFTLALLFIFLKPFESILDSSSQKLNVPLFYLFAVIVGSLHEQCVSIPFFLIFYYGYLRYKKYQIPSWYWGAILCFCIGLIFILLPSANPSRTLGYGGGVNWEFLGNTYNWLEMGIEKYFFAFVRHFILGRYTWMVLPYCMMYFYLLKLLYKKNPQNIYIQKSIFYFILSWCYVGVMSASPVFAGGPEDTGMFIIYIALCMVLYQNILEGAISEKTMKRVSIGVGTVFGLIVWLQFTAHFDGSMKFREMRRELEHQYYDVGLKEVVVTKPIENYYKIPIFTFNAWTFYMHRYYFEKYPKLESITLTNEDGVVEVLNKPEYLK